jgi:recombination protein RecT
VTTALVSNSKTIHDRMLSSRKQLADLIPVGLDVDRFLQIAWGVVRRNPALLDCTPDSILSAVAQGAQLGLSFDPVLGQAFIVPYKKTATFQAGYRGLCQLAYRSKRISRIYAEVVHKDDKFEIVMGTDPKIVHVPNLTVNREIEDDWIGAYAVATTVDGVTFSKFLSTAEILKRKLRSKSASSDYSPWKSDPKEMYLKTPVRTLAKFLPLSPETEEAIRAAIADEYEDAGIETMPTGAIEVETAALPAKNGGKTPPEPPRSQEPAIWKASWEVGGALNLGNVPTPISEQIKFKDFATFMPKRKVWLSTAECADDLVLLFADCGYDLKIPPEASAESGAAVAPPSAAPREPGVDEEIGI